MSIDINKEIREIYKAYFVELKEKSPELFNREEFSNIFVTGVLDNWTTATNRIMIVGEEAAWRETSEWGDDIESEVDNSQDWVIQFLHDQINPQKYGFKKNRRSFWERFRKIACELQDASFCYSNIDSINSRISKTGKLEPEDRGKLHALKDKLLGKVIEKLQPTVVLFCGWSERKEVFEKELSENVYNAFYKDCDKNKHSKHKIYVFKENEICYILSYHPSYSTNRIKGYEEAILETIKKQIKSNIKNYENRKN